MNSVGRSNHEVTVSVILTSDLVCIHLSPEDFPEGTMIFSD